jgi:hypothetical protein
MSNRDTLVSDVVFPLVDLTISETNGDTIKLNPLSSKLCGTGFFIGSEGFFLTAAHVVEGPHDGTLCGMFSQSGSWYTYNVIEYEKHEIHDIAIARFSIKPLGFVPSWLRVNRKLTHAALDYHMWSYPNNIAEMMAKIKNKQGDISFLPEMVFYKGYIRRRTSNELPFSLSKGNIFIELSEVGGSCASGSPVIDARLGAENWPVCGIYVAEETATFRAGYAVPSDVFADWCPAILGKPVADEFGPMPQF